MPRVILVLLSLALVVYAVIDCSRTPKDQMPGGIPKVFWLLVILLLFPIGPVAWIIASRVMRAEDHDGKMRPTLWSSPEPSPVKLPEMLGGGVRGWKNAREAQPTAPDNDPEFLARIDRELREAKRRKYEAEKASKQFGGKKDIPKPESEQANEDPGEGKGPESPPEAEADQPSAD